MCEVRDFGSFLCCSVCECIVLGKLSIIDCLAGKQTSGIHCKASTISVAFAPDGNTIAVLTKGSNQQIYLFDIRNELKMLRKVIYPADVRDLFFSTLRLHRAQHHSTLCDYFLQMHEILWSPDGSLFMMALSVPTPGGAIAVLNAQTMDTETSVRLPGHTGACWSIAMDPMRKYFASGGSDSFVNIWDMQELHCARSISASEFVTGFLHHSNPTIAC
jgi:WD40 repeat protein